MKKNISAFIISLAICGCASPSTPTHQHVFNKKIASPEYLSEKASCSHKAKYYYSCDCGEKSSETFEYGELTPHHVLNYTCKDCEKEFSNLDNYSLNEICISRMDDYKHPAEYTLKDNDTIIKELDILKDLNIPYIDLYGNVESATKENEAVILFNYHSKNIDLTEKVGRIKVQGSYSANCPKKNYTLKLDDKVKIVDSWGEQKKYCLKANYVDYSQSRNVVSAKIYSDVAKSRDLLDDYASTPNYGVIDGFPILIYFNNSYQGLYTFNIPKDKWMFKMKNSDEKNKAIIFADNWTKSTALNEPMAADFSNGWKAEFISNEESLVDPSTDWVSESFNKMYSFIHNNEGEALKNGLSTYINIPRCIDTMIYTYAIGAEDNISKNIIWTTYNGVQWTCTPYDMDDAWGLHWNGKSYFNPANLILDHKPDKNSWNKPATFLFGLLYDNYYEEIVNRYAELRSSILSQNSIENKFNEFFNSISIFLYKSESNKWQDVPSQDTNNKTQIFDWTKKHLELMDKALL